MLMHWSQFVLNVSTRHPTILSSTSSSSYRFIREGELRSKHSSYRLRQSNTDDVELNVRRCRADISGTIYNEVADDVVLSVLGCRADIISGDMQSTARLKAMEY